jgi:uncharacterized membrane protein required for colicin V production
MLPLASVILSIISIFFTFIASTLLILDSIYLNLFSLSIHKSANAGISRIYGLFFTFQ